MAACLLAACTHAPTDTYRAGPRAFQNDATPAVGEVVVVINANSFAGSHAGLFAGGRLYDPSGTYVGRRSEDRDWLGPSLADYLDYQRRDGPEVRFYRFRMEPADFQRLIQRIEQAGWSMPMFCARDVLAVLAGLGPFRGLDDRRWLSPVQLGERLEALIPAPERVGDCGASRSAPC